MSISGAVLRWGRGHVLCMYVCVCVRACVCIYTPCFIKNCTLCYFVISFLLQRQISWKSPWVHKRYWSLWAWNKYSWFVNYSLPLSLYWRCCKMSREQTQTRFILMQTSVYVDSENHHLLPKLFNILILQQMFKMSAVCRNTSTETLTPLLDSVVDDALVHALPLLSDALPQLIQSPDILWSTPHTR